MRLELRQLSGPALPGKARFFMERGRVTMGRSHACNWLVEDAGRTVSKQHCRIERDRNGYVLFDMSANGTRVDDSLLLEGQSKRLGNMSHIQLGAYLFEALVSGENDHDWDDATHAIGPANETLTISAILSDVSPGGTSALGILGRGNGDGWDVKVPLQSEKTAPSSRTVEIGWNGPPPTDTINRLPEDWNADFDMSSRFEHAAAPQLAVPIIRPRPEPGEKAAVPDRAFNAVFDAETTTAHVREPAPDDDLHPLLMRQEAVLERICTEFGLHFKGAASATAAERLTRIADVQEELAHRIEQLTAQGSKILEPAVIEARVDACGRVFPWKRKGAYWAEYKKQFNASGETPSVHHALISAVASALDNTNEKETSEER